MADVHETDPTDIEARVGQFLQRRAGRRPVVIKGAGYVGLGLTMVAAPSLVACGPKTGEKDDAPITGLSEPGTTALLPVDPATNDKGYQTGVLRPLKIGNRWHEVEVDSDGHPKVVPLREDFEMRRRTVDGAQGGASTSPEAVTVAGVYSIDAVDPITQEWKTHRVPTTLLEEPRIRRVTGQLTLDRLETEFHAVGYRFELQAGAVPDLGDVIDKP